jgi:hypothetical protein
MATDEFIQAPELALYRDVVFMYKLALEPSSRFFGTNRRLNDINLWMTNDVRPLYIHLDTNGDRTVSFVQTTIGDSSVPVCYFTSNQILSPTSLNLPTEEIILHRENLEDFKNSLSQEEAEAFLQFLTVPYLSIPLMLQFFSQERVGVLVQPRLQQILESVLFEPRGFASSMAVIYEVPVPADARSEKLGTPYGVLFCEICHGPDCILRPLLDICRAAAGFCIGDFSSSFVSLLLFVVRLSVRIISFFLFAQRDPQLRECHNPSNETLNLLSELKNFLKLRANKILRKWLEQSEAAGIIEKSTEFHSHLALINANNQSETKVSGDEALKDTTAYVSSVAFTISWHSKSVSQRLIHDPSKPMTHLPTHSVPIHDVFYSYQRLRSSVTLMFFFCFLFFVFALSFHEMP